MAKSLFRKHRDGNAIMLKTPFGVEILTRTGRGTWVKLHTTERVPVRHKDLIEKHANLGGVRNPRAFKKVRAVH